jgi:hypothetical protein
MYFIGRRNAEYRPLLWFGPELTGSSWLASTYPAAAELHSHTSQQLSFSLPYECWTTSLDTHLWVGSNIRSIESATGSLFSRHSSSCTRTASFGLEVSSIANAAVVQSARNRLKP